MTSLICWTNERKLTFENATALNSRGNSTSSWHGAEGEVVVGFCGFAGEHKASFWRANVNTIHRPSGDLISGLSVIFVNNNRQDCKYPDLETYTLANTKNTTFP